MRKAPKRKERSNVRISELDKKLLRALKKGRVAGRERHHFQHETGHVDLAGAIYALNTTGSVTLLNTVATGASSEQRVGKRILMKSLTFRGNSQSDSTTTFGEGAFMVVYDKKPGAAAPAITDILDSIAPSSMNNDDTTERFRILKRVNRVFIGAKGSANPKSAYVENFWLDLRDLPTIYKSVGTGAIGDIETGALWLISVGSVAAGTADSNLVGAFRLRYMDI